MNDDRAALEGDSRIRESGLPTFVIGNVGPTAERPTPNPDRCSVHGNIPGHVSIAGHLQTHHGITYDEWKALTDLVPARESTPDEPRPGTRCRCRHGCEATYGPGAQGWGRGLCGYCNERHDVKNDMAHGDPIEVRSCLVCGQPTETFAVRHGGYPFIGACFRCRDAGNRAKDDASRAALATPAIEPGIDEELLKDAMDEVNAEIRQEQRGGFAITSRDYASRIAAAYRATPLPRDPA